MLRIRMRTYVSIYSFLLQNSVADPHFSKYLLFSAPEQCCGYGSALLYVFTLFYSRTLLRIRIRTFVSVYSFLQCCSDWTNIRYTQPHYCLGKHIDTVWQVKWGKDNLDGYLNFYSGHNDYPEMIWPRGIKNVKQTLHQPNKTLSAS